MRDIAERTVRLGVDPNEYSFRLRLGRVLNNTIFVSLLALIVLTAIPYGTAEIWWKAIFLAAFFALGALAVIESLLNGNRQADGWPVLAPLLLLVGYALVQSFSLGLGGANAAGLDYPRWNTISADPYHTRLFALQLLGLTLAAALLYRFAASRQRLSALINVIIVLAVVSAIFGILRQTTQQEVGFVLPLLKPNQGYGQFINKNHFAFLMEMALGLGLGMIAGGGIKRERALIYVASLLPIWTALVLSNSRGGLIAMLAQVIVAALLLTSLPASRSSQLRSRVWQLGKQWPVRVVLLILLVGGVSAGTIWLGGDRLVSNLESVRGEFNPVTSEPRQGANRNEIWRATWLMFKDHPLAGVGLAGYTTAIPAYHDASGVLTPQEAHNEYLELLSSGGLVGAAIGVWFAIVVIRYTRRNLRASDRFRRAAALGASLGIVGVAVHSMVDFGLHMIVNALVFAALIVIATTGIEYEN